MSKRLTVNPRTKDILWHGGKTLLCLVQFFCLTLGTFEGIAAMASQEVEDVATVPYLSLFAIAQLVLFIALWKYYDNEDDRAFDRFCEAEETPVLLRDPAYLVGLVLTAIGGTLILSLSFAPLLRAIFPALNDVPAAAIALLLAALVAGGGSVLRLRRLGEVWSIQKTLRRPTDKRIKPVKRVLWAIIYFVALAFATQAVPALLMAFGSLILTFILLLEEFVFLLLGIIVALWAFFFFRQVAARRKFLGRLKSLRDKGMLSFEVHGHPYLSLLFRRVEYSLTIVDEPHPESRVKAPTTYQVAVANCNHRRMMVVLCPDNVFQIVLSLKIRAIGSIGLGRSDIMTIPLASIFLSHRFHFPEGEGKRILLVDPAPANLTMRGFRKGEYLPLDNASEQFGYIVYGKNSFLNVLERS